MNLCFTWKCFILKIFWKNRHFWAIFGHFLEFFVLLMYQLAHVIGAKFNFRWGLWTCILPKIARFSIYIYKTVFCMSGIASLWCKWISHGRLSFFVTLVNLDYDIYWLWHISWFWYTLTVAYMFIMVYIDSGIYWLWYIITLEYIDFSLWLRDIRYIVTMVNLDFCLLQFW